MCPDNNRDLANEVFNLHIKVLIDILLQVPFNDILEKYKIEFQRTNYLQLIKKSGHLSFDSDNKLIGAYPISPVKTDYIVDIEGIGSGYSMCAIDAIGTAYTFMRKVKIKGIDTSSGQDIEIEIDPLSHPQSVHNLFVTYQECPEELQGDNSAAIIQCPTINFYTSKSDIPGNLVVWDFQEALKYSQIRFGRQQMISLIEEVI